jgi:peptidoglycan hydrolase-like amidase
MFVLAIAATVKIGVFGLFHPTQLDLRPVNGNALVLQADGQSKNLVRGDVIHLKPGYRATGLRGAMTVFMVSVPGKIHREFYGRLEVREFEGHLIPVIETDRELAVSAVASSEMQGVPLEAMKAQVVATRSYLAALPAKHAEEGYDFCDTTHCSYFRGRTQVGYEAPRAVNLTKSLAVVHQGKVVATLYSSNCGGETHLPVDAGWAPGFNYPYFRVACPLKTEQKGHGVGMCQRGAIEMAKEGATFRDILAHYFPATAIEALQYRPFSARAGL